MILKKTAAFLFGIGFVIGILLEITLIEKGRLLSIYKFLGRTDDKPPTSLACVIFLKQPENLAASEKTWLENCDEVFAVRVKRHGETKWIRLEDDNPSRVVNNNEVCERTRVLNVTANSAWAGLCKVLHLMKSSHCEWFMLSPDNLLVLVDNLKVYVSDLDPNMEHYLGHAITHFEADYNTLSAGVLISRGTLQKLVGKFSLEDCETSGKYWRNEDLYLGRHLKQMGILPKDTRDEDGRGRFHGYSINVLLKPGKLFAQSDYSRKALYPVPTGLNCCSPNLITIDATNSIRMYHHYYYIYKLRETTENTKTTERSQEFNWKDFLRSEGYNDTAIENMTNEEYYQIWAKKIPPEELYDRMRKELGS